MVKNLPVMPGTCVGKIPWRGSLPGEFHETEDSGGLQSMG